MKVTSENHNHEMTNILVGYSYAEILKSNEHAMVVDMTKILVKLTKILLTLEENNGDNETTTLKQVYNVRYAYMNYKKDEELKCIG